MAKTAYRTKVVVRKGGSYPNDILSGGDYVLRRLEPMPDEATMKAAGWHPVNLGEFDINPYGAAERLGIDLRRVRTSSAYRCPATDLRFQGVVPMCLLTKDMKVNYPDTKHRHLDMISDADWQWQMCREFDKPGSYERALLGSGYHDCCMHYDGFSEAVPALMRLANGDALVVMVWDWFNK